MKLKRQFDNKFHELLDELMKAWEIVDISKFMHTKEALAILFTQKIQEIVNTNTPTVTVDFETKNAEDKLMKLNNLLDTAINKKNNLLKSEDWKGNEEKK